MKKYLLILMSFFMVILGITSFSNVENEKVPNELIINNPKKEVTTIESLKNREHGEMNISVTKINPIPITGIERDGKLEFELPEKVELEENIFVTDDVNKIQEHRTLKLNKNLTTFSLENQTEKTKLKVDKPSDSKKIYIAVKEQDKIKRVYENTYMNYNSIDLGRAYIYVDGRVHLGNLYDSNFNRVTSGELYIGKDGKVRHNGRKFDLTTPLKSDTSSMNNTPIFGNIILSSVYISSNNETIHDGDYFYNKNGHFGLVLRKSKQLGWIANGIKDDGNPAKDLPGIKVPKSYYGGFGHFENIKVGAKYDANKDYHYTTLITHSGYDIETFTKTIDIDMDNVAQNGVVYLDGKFNTRESNFLTCLYTQVDSLPIYENKHENVIASVMTVEENNKKVGDSGVKGPSKFPDFKVTVDNKYEFNYYQKWGSAYGDDLHFSIKKLGENVGNKKYTIKVYSGRDYHILLGVLNLNIKNGVAPPEPPSPPIPVPPPAPIVPLEIGSATFSIDSRFINRWIYGDGKTSKNLEGYKEEYNALVQVSGFNGNLLNNSTIISNVEVSKGYISENRSNYKIFTISNGKKIAIPINTRLSELNNKIAIYGDNWVLFDEIIRIELTGSDKKKYIGNIRITGKGSGVENTQATLDLSKWKLKDKQTRLYWGQFPVGIISNGNFFNFISRINYNAILTNLNITSSLGENQQSVRQGNDEIEVILKNNKIGVHNSKFYFTKESTLIQPITYTIKGYYKDILLGTTTITITNENKPIDIGTAKFEVDKRLESLYKTGSGKWIFADGDLAEGLNKNQFIKNYERFVKVTGFNSLPRNIKIIDGEMTGKISNSIEYEYRNNYRYKIFETNNGNNATAIPKVEFSQLNKALVIHKTNKTNIDKITMLGSDNNKYLGILEQEFVGENAKTTTTTLDLSDWQTNQWGRWNYPNKKETSSLEGQSAVLKGDTFFYWKSSVKTNGHILTKLKITEVNNNLVKETNNQPNQKFEIDFTNNIIGIDKNGLFICKKTNSSQPVKYIIEGYYQDIKLGQTTITITNQKNSFELVGDNTLDFGNMIYDSYNPYYRKEKLFKVKNPSNANLKFSVASSTGTIKNEMDNLKLENIKISESKNNGNGESSFLLGASAKVEKNTKPGKYTGEIQVIVDIDGTGK